MDAFNLELEYKGRLLELPCTLQQWGYTHRIVVDMEGVQVTLEPDEERHYRALVMPADIDKADPVLLGKVVEEIEKILRQ